MSTGASAMDRSDLIFPPEPWHNHASCLVELPNRDLVVCWYHGSGEREADDVLIECAKLPAGTDQWTDRFLLADTPGYPDCNPILFLDGRARLWLVYVTILANEWHTALLKYHVSSDYRQAGPPRWETSGVLHVTPGEEFSAAVGGVSDTDFARIRTQWQSLASDKLLRRLGWMPRAHPALLDRGRIVLPLYSDGFGFSLMLLSDDNGETWHTSSPLVSLGGVQPTVVQRRDGVLVAFMRDNGPSPGRVMRSESRDLGETWSPVRRTDIPNPGSGLEVTRLASGAWLMICNDVDDGRYRLAAMLSEDEGGTWPYRQYLENDAPGPGSGSYSYPSAIQAQDGTIHVSYTYARRDLGSAIKHASFAEAWLHT